jgi:hypothetical protein
MKTLVKLLLFLIIITPFQLKAAKRETSKFKDQVRVIPYFESESFLPGVGTIIQYKMAREITFLELDVGVSSISLNAGLKTTLSLACQFDEKKQNVSLGAGIFDYKILAKEKNVATWIVPVAYGYVTEEGNYFKVGANTFYKNASMHAHPFMRMGHIF